ncbi:hypothetical protein R1flu_006893 [Riccia fluitans]|uniref:DNA-3-methyladenine glycosylase I n=1 Tax=Riccia fluitans TaxID=41844 RepID=A0ABD1YYE2_9MARC
MCRERDVESELGEAVPMTPVQHQLLHLREMDGGGTMMKPPKGLSVKLGAGNPDKEHERVKELEKMEGGLARPVLGPHKTTSQSPRLLPFFPKSSITSPPQSKSLARNPSPARVTSRIAPAPATKAAVTSPATTISSSSSTRAAPPRNASPAPAARAAARNPSPGPAARASARHPSPTPAASRASARNPSPAPASRATARNPSPTPASKATARNPSPTTAPRATARNPSPAPASKASARNPSPTPGASRLTARNPSPASKATARSSSPAPAGKTSMVSGASAGVGVKPGLTRSSSGLSAAASSGRRAVSPSVGRRELRSAPGVNRSGDIGKKSMASVLFPSSKQSQVLQSSLMTASFSSDGSSKEESVPASPMSARRLPTSALEDLQALRNLRMSSTSSDGSPSRASSVKGDLRSSECGSPVLSTKKLGSLDFDVLRKARESCSSSEASSTKDDSVLEVESPTISGKKVGAMEVQSLMKYRLLNSSGKRAGPPKASRVACEGMLPTSPVSSIVVPSDSRKRCHWVTPQSEPILIAYHDEEWGVPVHNDRMLFELLVLEGAQAELDRPQILGLRDYFRQVFAGFDPEIVAKFDAKKIGALAADDVLGQTEPKIRGIVENAKQVVKIAEEFGSFNKYVWMFVGFKPIVNLPRLFTQVPVKSSKSEALSKDLMRRGFRYVGPTTIYSFMQAAGMVNDHLTGCFRHSQCSSTPQTTLSASPPPPPLAPGGPVAETSENRVY